MPLSRTAPFTIAVCFRSGITVLLSGILTLAAQIDCSASGTAIWGRDSFGSSGLLCFRTFNETNTQIHLAQYVNGKFSELFVKNMDYPVMAPICLTNGVIVTSSDGVVRKLNLAGDFLFVAKPKGFDGVLGLCGIVSDTCIFMQETLQNTAGKGFNFRLWLVDVSGVEPIVTAKFNIIQPWRITRAVDEIIVVGPTNTLRFKIP